MPILAPIPWDSPLRQANGQGRPPPVSSIAVLPFDELDDESRQKRLGEGLADDIIYHLSRFRQLVVISRHSSFSFGHSASSSERIGEALGVGYFVRGSVLKTADRLEVEVRLTDASASEILWTDRYRGDAADLLELQEDVTSVITGGLAVQIETAERTRPRLKQAGHPSAQRLILEGEYLTKQYKLRANRHARNLFERAAFLDASCTRAYAGLSRTCNLDWRYAWGKCPEASLERAMDLAQLAIDHDPFDAYAHAELGVSLLYSKQYDAALAAYERAVELNPNDPDILAEMADCLTSIGQIDRAVEMLQLAWQRNPLRPGYYLRLLSETFFSRGDYEATIRTLLQMSDRSEAHRVLAASYAHLGLLGQARHHAEQVPATHPNFSLAHWRKVPPNKQVDITEVLIDGLQRAGLQ